MNFITLKKNIIFSKDLPAAQKRVVKNATNVSNIPNNESEKNGLECFLDTVFNNEVKIEVKNVKKQDTGNNLVRNNWKGFSKKINPDSMMFKKIC